MSSFQLITQAGFPLCHILCVGPFGLVAKVLLERRDGCALPRGVHCRGVIGAFMEYVKLIALRPFIIFGFQKAYFQRKQQRLEADANS